MSSTRPVSAVADTTREFQLLLISPVRKAVLLTGGLNDFPFDLIDGQGKMERPTNHLLSFLDRIGRPDDPIRKDKYVDPWPSER